MPKRIIVCFDRTEEPQVMAFAARLRVVEEEKGRDPDLLEIEIIYPCDISNNEYMSWTGTDPGEREREILASLTADDKIYVWGHGAPNYSYIPGSNYTEFANYLEKGITKENFDEKRPLRITVEICNGGRGGEAGKDSYAARLHSVLGKKGIEATVTGRLRNVFIDISRIATDGIKTIERGYEGLFQAGIFKSEESYIRMAPRSKVTYMWDKKNSNMQIRVDSYRKSTLRGFKEIKENISDRIGQAHLPFAVSRKILECLFCIENTLCNDTRQVDVEALRADFSELKKMCITLGMSEAEMKKIGMDYFEKMIGKKVTKNGILKTATGNRKDDLLLPIEAMDIVDAITSHASLIELDRLSQILGESESPFARELAQFIGSSNDPDGETLYSWIVQSTRMYNLSMNDGRIVMPSHVEEILEFSLKALRQVLQSDSSPEEKMRNIVNLKNKISFKNTKYNFVSTPNIDEEKVDEEKLSKHEKDIFFKWDSESNFNYKIMVGGSAVSGKIDISDFPDALKVAAGGHASLLDNDCQDFILKVLLKRGHAQVMLGATDRFMLFFSSVSQGMQEVQGERHEASYLEYFGNSFYAPYVRLDANVDERTLNVNQLVRLVLLCEDELHYQRERSLQELVGPKITDSESPPGTDQVNEEEKSLSGPERSNPGIFFSQESVRSSPKERQTEDNPVPNPRQAQK